MNAQDFAYWLQGFAELNGAPPTPEQWQAIQDHLKLVFTKVTPLRQGGPIGLGQVLFDKGRDLQTRQIC